MIFFDLLDTSQITLNGDLIISFVESYAGIELGVTMNEFHCQHFTKCVPLHMYVDFYCPGRK